MSFLRVREIYHRVSSAPAEDRLRLLDEACAGDAALRAEVESLLGAGERAGAFLAEPTLNLQDEDRTRVAEAPPIDFGRYRLLERLGEGGYGEVFLAEQSEPVKRRVALKMLKAGLDSKQVLARFEAERQTLALMDHPGIARIFDAGTTPQGRPYFVMEFVDGVPVTEYCLLHRVAPRERLELFCDICRAVQHAHARGVIHRDLKPSNVLVTSHEGRARAVVIDFGIAKAMRGMDPGSTLHTGLRQLMGTPAYMSPEQAGLGGPDVDTRSDVYSLGVLLYELLTGVTPLDAAQLKAAALAELQRRISEEVPPRPSTRVASLTADKTYTGARAEFAAPVRLLRGDLDWIVMKALEKEPERRYSTAAAFADDLARHLNHEPVTAGPPSTVYRLRKWVRRHRAAAAAVAVMLAAAAVGAGGLVRGYVIARREAAARKIQADRAESLLALQTQIFESANPENAKGGDYTVRQLLEDFSVRFRDSLGVEPEVEISLRRTVGRAWQMLGGSNRPEGTKDAPSERERSDLEHAEEHFRAALALAIKTEGGESDPAASCRQSLGWLLRDRGFYSKAAEELRPAMETFSRNHGPGAPSTLSAGAMLATVMLQLDDKTTALALAREAAAWPGDSSEAVQPLQLAAKVCLACGDLPTAAAAGEKSLAIARRLSGAKEGPRLILPLLTLAEIRAAAGNQPESIGLAEAAHRIAKEFFGEKHPETGKAMLRLTALRKAGGAPTAEGTAAAGTLRSTIGDAHPDTIAGMAALMSAVNTDEARNIGERFAGIAAGGRANGAPVMVEKLPAWVQGLVTDGRLKDFEGVTRSIIEMSRRQWGDDHLNTLDAERILAEMYASQSEFDKALEVLRPNLEKTRRRFGESHPLTTEGMILMARLHRWKKDYPAMEKMVEECLPILAGRPQDTTAGYHWNWLAEILHGRYRYQEAVDCYYRALPLLSAGKDQDAALRCRLQGMRAAQMAGFSLGTRDICRDVLSTVRGLTAVSATERWTAEQSAFSTLEGTLLWRDGGAFVPALEERAADRATPSKERESILGVTRAFHSRTRVREEGAREARRVWETAAKDNGPLHERSIAALRTWIAACGNAGGIPELDEALAKMEEVHAGAPDSLTKAEAQAELTWYRALFRGMRFDDAFSRMMEAAGAVTGSSSPMGSMRVLNRVASFGRYSGHSREVTPVVDAATDRMAGQSWPAEETVTLVPRFHKWLQGTPISDPGEGWRSDAGFEAKDWGYKMMPLGNAARIGPASSFDVEAPVDVRLPLLARTTFSVADPASLGTLKLRLRCADGAIFWINGKEALRRRVPAEVVFTGTASGEPASPEPDLSVISNPDPALLRPGVNVLAVAVYFSEKRTGASGALLDCSLEARKKTGTNAP